jgi:hypothetical protein
MCVHKSLSVKHFHAVSTRNAYECLLKLSFGKASHKKIKQHLGFEDVATSGFDSVMSHVYWVYCAYILLHLSPPGVSVEAKSLGDKQRALQQGLADQEKRQILQKLTQIDGVQRYKDELRQALAGT